MEATTTEHREFDSVITPTGDQHITETVTVEQSSDVSEVAPVVVVDPPDDGASSVGARLDALVARMDSIVAMVADVTSSGRGSQPAAEPAPVAAEPAESETVVAVTEDVAPKPADATEGETKSESKPRKKAAGVIF